MFANKGRYSVSEGLTLNNEKIYLIYDNFMNKNIGVYKSRRKVQKVLNMLLRSRQA